MSMDKIFPIKEDKSTSDLVKKDFDAIDDTIKKDFDEIKKK